MNDLQSIISFLREYDGEPIKIMEVCGTHTAEISGNGIHQIVSPKIKLISGPGCPVCVTVASYIDKLAELSKTPDTCVVTFGDMIRVCGTYGSLNEAKAEGGNVKMVYSPFEILKMANESPKTTFVFAAVGFETTTPVYAVLVDQIIKEGIKNIKLLTALKTMPAVIDTLCSQGIEVDGFIAPGNVSVITGSEIFKPLAEKYSLPFVVANFEGEGLVKAIYALIKLKGMGKVENFYTEAVTDKGNNEAKKIINKYFTSAPAAWRGLGVIENSGMVLKKEYEYLDAGSFNLIEDSAKTKGCRCTDVVCGRIAPSECGLFRTKCTPDTPQGACMVSTEGSCFNYFVNKRE